MLLCAGVLCMGTELYESLLKSHEDTITYCVPEIEMEGDQWVEIGLFPWQIDSVPIGRPVPDDPSEEEVNELLEHAEGIGLRLQGNSQAFKPPRDLITERVTDSFDVYSRGSSQTEGLRYRIEDGTPYGVRQLGRELVLATFAYWWWLANSSDYNPHTVDVRWSNTQPEIARVTNEGVVVTKDGDRVETPYSLDDVELLLSHEYEKPREACEKRLRAFIEELGEEYAYNTVKTAYANAGGVLDEMAPDIEKTDARKQEDELRYVTSELKEVRGIGRRTQMDMVNKFADVDELCDAIRERDERFMSLTQVTSERRTEMIDVLEEMGVWSATTE